MSASWLLYWVQTAFVYEYDDKVWGHDRAFFAEESLSYPYCDCEDRSILFSRLVRDLLGLDVILVFYPGHLATAVAFTDNVDGDYIELNGKHYIICVNIRNVFCIKCRYYFRRTLKKEQYVLRRTL